MKFPIWWESHKIPWFQTTNQLDILDMLDPVEVCSLNMIRAVQCQIIWCGKCMKHPRWIGEFEPNLAKLNYLWSEPSKTPPFVVFFFWCAFFACSLPVLHAHCRLVVSNPGTQSMPFLTRCVPLLHVRPPKLRHTNLCLPSSWPFNNWIGYLRNIFTPEAGFSCSNRRVSCQICLSSASWIP